MSTRFSATNVSRFAINIARTDSSAASAQRKNVEMTTEVISRVNRRIVRLHADMGEEWALM
jgi:hypothetical protein